MWNVVLQLSLYSSLPGAFQDTFVEKMRHFTANTEPVILHVIADNTDHILLLPSAMCYSYYQINAKICHWYLLIIWIWGASWSSKKNNTAWKALKLNNFCWVKWISLFIFYLNYIFKSVKLKWRLNLKLYVFAGPVDTNKKEKDYDTMINPTCATSICLQAQSQIKIPNMV